MQTKCHRNLTRLY